MAEKLNPCPLCGRDVELYFDVLESDHPNDDDYVIAWPSCNCPLRLKASAGYGNYFDQEPEREEARLNLIEEWNCLSRA